MGKATYKAGDAAIKVPLNAYAASQAGDSGESWPHWTRTNTARLTAGCSAIELVAIVAGRCTSSTTWPAALAQWVTKPLASISGAASNTLTSPPFGSIKISRMKYG